MSRPLENVEGTSLSSILNYSKVDRIFSIKELKNADSNFLITSLMKEMLDDKFNKVLLVMTHNTMGHYRNTGKKIGFDLLKHIEDKNLSAIEMLKSISDLDQDVNYKSPNYFNLDSKDIIKELFLEIKEKINFIYQDWYRLGGGRVYLIFDDVSHLLDLGVSKTDIIAFLNSCSSILPSEFFGMVINCHISSTSDAVISRAIDYIADVHIRVSPLDTGSSQNVNGSISIKKENYKKEMRFQESVFHYKVNDKEIKVFAPGHSVNYLYK